jgi:arginase family enzyme
MLPIILNFDDSVAAQAAIAANASEIIDLTSLRDDLRLSAASKALGQLRQSIRHLRQKYPQPWLTFLGSGDFHHIALALIESLPKENPFHLILVDNHPDWFFERPAFHCGNWVSAALDHVQSATLVGQNSPDLKPHRFRRAPFDHLCDGRITFYPQSLTQIHVPLKWPTIKGRVPLHGRGTRPFISTLFGTCLTFDTLAAHGASTIFKRTATALAGKNIYLSIDKDVLRPADAVTDWEQGELTLAELAAGVRTICTSCNVIGADICGDHSPHPLTGLWKRLDAGRWKNELKSHAIEVNQCANLTLLSALGSGTCTARPS